MADNSESETFCNGTKKVENKHIGSQYESVFLQLHDSPEVYIPLRVMCMINVCSSVHKACWHYVFVSF